MPYDYKTGQVTFPGYDSLADIRANLPSAMPQTAPLSQGSNYEKYLRVMTGGNFADTLSGADKLMALSALLGSVTRGSKTSPQKVIADLRKEQLGKLEAQVMAERMQAATRRKMDFLNSLPEAERRMAMLLDEDKLQDYMLKRMAGREETDAEKKLRAAGIDPLSQEGQRILKNVAASQGIISVTGPAGTTYVQASDVVLGGSGAPNQGTQIPQKAIDDLRAGKGTVEQFEAVFGKGTARQYLGGGSGNATGGFR